MNEWILASLAFLAGLTLGLLRGVDIVLPIVLAMVKRTYDNVYDRAVSDALKRLNANKKNN